MNEATINGLISGLERQVFYRNDMQQFIDCSQMIQNPSTVLEIVDPPSFPGNDKLRQTPVISPSQDNHAGIISSNSGADFFFERVWVQPVVFNPQFLTEDTTDELKIWNSHRSRTVQVTDISVLNQDGTDLDYPSLPDIIGIFGGTVYTLTIYQDGPPVQDTTYTLTIDGNEFDVDIGGIRIVPWYLDANWDSQLKIAYEFVTTIWSNDKLTEQRRAISRESWFSLSASFDANGINGRKVMNLIGYSKDKVIGVPVYNEKMTASVATQGTTTITINEDFTYYYNMQNRASFIALIDHDNDICEIKKVSALNGTNEIELEQNILNDFNLGRLCIYPCMFVVIAAFSGNQITDDFDEVKVDFKEFKSGG